MEKQLTTAQLRYSSVVRIFLLLLCLSGGGSLWAETTHRLSLNGSAQESEGTNEFGTTSFFTVSGNYNTKFTGATYDGITFTSGLKMESQTGIISFTTTHSTATVTIVQSTWKANEETKTIKLDNTEIGIPASESGTGYYEYVINNVAAGNHTITRGGGESGVFYVKVVESGGIVIPDSDFGFAYTAKKAYMDETYEGNLFVNLLNVSPITFSSSNTNVATVDSSTGAVTLQGVGTATITASFAGEGEYAEKTASYTLTVGAALSKTDIPISALRYQPGVNGINGSQMARAVGGFNLTFSSNDGIKCNNTNNFYFRTNSSGAKGTMQIAMNSSNSSKYIKKIVFTAWNDPLLAVTSVAKTSGTLTKTGEREWTWTNFAEDVTSVNFTSQGENGEYFLVSNIEVYTTEAPTFQKVTPTPAFNRNSDSFNTGASVNISDLAINTTPVNFLFDYTYNAGATTLTHTPYSTNTTWPGTITGTAAEGTATISASFDGSSNPFYNSVASTNVYTLTVTTPAKNTFVWDFTQTLSDVDTKLLTADATNWNFASNQWKPQTAISGTAITATTNATANPIEYFYGLDATWTANSYSFMYQHTNGNYVRVSKNDKITIPNLQVGDIVTVVSKTAGSSARGINPPANLSVTAGFTPSTEQITNIGTVTVAGDVDLVPTDHLNFISITVESANKAWPTLSFANGSTPSAEVPYSGESTTYTNALTSVPAGATATYSILLDENAGGASAASINTSTGELTLKAAGEVIVRATVTAGTNNSAYYCDYILTVTQASQYASWTYSADEKEIDGENRPYQGTVTFTSSGVIANGTKITDIPGLEVAFTAAGTVSNISTGNQNKYNGLALDGNGNVTFTPSVNGYLSIQGNFYINTSLGSISITNENHTYYPTLTELTTPLIAGTTYTLSATGYNFNLAAFTFRPAFLTPDETAEQTATFVANSSTTAFPKLVHSADAGVRFSGNRSVVNLSNDGGVTLVGGGTAVVRGKVIAGDNELTASYTLEANVLSVASMTPTDGSTITTLDNSSVYIQFSDKISTTVDATKVVVLKDAQQLTGINVAKAGSSVSLYEKTLVLSNFPAMEAGSTYTIRLMSGCVSKEEASDVKNPEFIGTFTVESSEPPLNWVYPSTTSAVRIGTSIVLQTNNNIDENYPNGGVIGTLTYDGDADDSDYPMNLVAIKDGKNLVFKPTKPMVPNKLYTLTIGANQVKLKDATSMITKDKVFMFTTGTATGTAPELTSSTPADGAVIDLPSSTTKIDLYFNQNLELEPYSTVSIIPVNGSESLSRGSSEKLNDNGVLVAQNMTIDSEDPTHLSFEVGSDLKYDLYYEMVIPANIVTAPGGMPNSAYTVKFKVNRNPNSTEVTPATFYPHTWDFNKFGNQTVATTTAYNIINNCGDPGTDDKRVNSLYYDSTNNNYTTKAQNGYGFDQGNNVYFNNKNGVKETLDEFEGIRISLVKSTSNRFELAKTEQINADGTTKWQFRMNGNTHYMTLSNVPAGKLYMVINSPYIGINSPNATFESVSGEGYTLENDNTLLNTNGTKKVVIDVTEAGDVSFCVKNFTCEKIAVAAHTKTFKKNYVKDGKTYATDCLNYDVRYDLLNAFTDHSVKAYYITDMANSTGNTATVTATEVNQVNAVKGSQGVLVVYQGAVENDTEVPVFKTDVNTSAKEVVESGATPEQLENLFKTRDKIATKPADHYLYVLSYTGSQGGDLGFYNYVGSAYIDRAAYLFISKEWVGEDPYGSGTTSARKVSLITIDAEGVTTGVSEVETEKTPNNDGYFYNLNGMRVEHPKAGIYIRNGKKVVMK